MIRSIFQTYGFQVLILSPFGPHFCYQRSPFDPYFTQNSLILKNLGPHSMWEQWIREVQKMSKLASPERPVGRYCQPSFCLNGRFGFVVDIIFKCRAASGSILSTIGQYHRPFVDIIDHLSILSTICRYYRPFVDIIDHLWILSTIGR